MEAKLESAPKSRFPAFVGNFVGNFVEVAVFLVKIDKGLRQSFRQSFLRETAFGTSSKLPAPRAWLLACHGEGNPLGLGRDAVGQMHVPAPFVLVHLEHNGCFAWRMVAGRLDEEKIGTHVRDADGVAIDDQPHLHVGRMCAVTLFRYHERNADT